MTRSLKDINIHTISLFSVGEVRWDLDQTSLIDTHPHQSFVHPLDQLLLANKHVIGAATVITETDTHKHITFIPVKMQMPVLHEFSALLQLQM